MSEAGQDPEAPEPPDGPGAAPEEDEDEELADHERRKYRSAKRKARARAGEIKDLNITAMMDMMTILLVFLLKSYTASSSALQMTDDLQVPNSTTQKDPKDRIVITVAFNELAVNDKRAAAIANGLIPPEAREGGQAASMMVPGLYDALGKEVEKQKKIAEFNPAAPFTGEVNVVADKRVPYRTVLAVLYTAGQAELSHYQLMALKNE